MNPDEKQVTKIGPGGYKCTCCGPAPKMRPKWRRLIRRRLKALTYKRVKEALKE